MQRKKKPHQFRKSNPKMSQKPKKLLQHQFQKAKMLRNKLKLHQKNKKLLNHKK
jgi:hypothetical protein